MRVAGPSRLAISKRNEVHKVIGTTSNAADRDAVEMANRSRLVDDRRYNYSGRNSDYVLRHKAFEYEFHVHVSEGRYA